MSIFYIFFFILLNFLTYKLIKHNSKLISQVTFSFIFFILISLSIPIYKFFYIKSQMINGFTFFVLLSFTFLITVINLFHDFSSKRFKQRLKSDTVLSGFSNQFTNVFDYTLIITLIVTLFQLFIIWKKIEFSNNV